MRVRLGTPVFAGVVQQQNAAVPRPRQRCDSVHRSISVGSVAHQQSARLTCERQRGQHSPLPPFFRGHSSVSRAGASHAPGRRRDSFCPHHFCPCGVVQSTCLPLMQEITGAKPVRDANSIALKALSAMRSLGKRISSVQFRVGAPVFGRVVKREQQTPQIENLRVPPWRDVSPLSPTNFKESKPQQTGTGLLIRNGEVTTTSGSSLRPRRRSERRLPRRSSSRGLALSTATARQAS